MSWELTFLVQPPLGRVIGPLGDDEVRDALREGRFPAGTRVRLSGGSAVWLPPEAFATFASVGVASSAVLPAAPTEAELAMSGSPDLVLAVPEVIEDGVTGVIVDRWRDMPAALERADAIDSLVQRRVVEERFSPERMVADYVGAYEATIERWGLRTAPGG